jgi:hypothetical protein
LSKAADDVRHLAWHVVAQQNLAFFAPRTRTVFTKLEYLILNHPG